jgi:hypothetical protein
LATLASEPLAFLADDPVAPAGGAAGQPDEAPSSDGALGPPLLGARPPLVDQLKEHAHKAFGYARGRFDSLEPKHRRQLTYGVPAGIGLAILAAAAICVGTRPSLRAPAVASFSQTNLASPPAPVPAESAAAPAPAASRASCVRSGEPIRLSPKVSKDVPVELRASADGSQLGIGFALDARTAAGLVAQLPGLELKQQFRRPADKLGRVIAAAGQAGFSLLVHAGARPPLHQDSLTIRTLPTMLAAWNGDELRVSGEGVGNDTSWKLEQKPSAVRAAAVGAREAVLALRIGDSVKLGWVKEDGTSAGPLRRVPSAGMRLGTPSIAWNGKDALVAFAERETDEAPWGLRVARARLGAEPWSSESWAVPAGGPGGQTIAPSVAALQGGGWLMVWTEGAQGSRAVRMQTLDAELAPVGEAQTVSSEGNAGQGTGIVAEGQGAVVYLAGTRAHELWAVRVQCR